MLHGRNAGNSIHIGKVRLCKSAEKNCPEAGSYYSCLACREHPRQRALRSAARYSVFETETACSKTLCQVVRQYALKQECVETNGDGVKPGSPPAGLGGANVQARTHSSEFEHFYPVPVCFGVIKRFKRDNIVSSNIMFEVLLGRLRTRNVALKDFCSCFALYCAERCGFTDLFGVLPTTFWAKKKFDYIADTPTCRRQRWTIPRGKKTTEQANACSVMFYA